MGAFVCERGKASHQLWGVEASTVLGCLVRRKAPWTSMTYIKE